MTDKPSFKDLNLIPPLEKAITKQGYKVPTPIQIKAIPGLLEGKDLVGIAQTGTGKTAAFVLPILQQMTPHHPRRVTTLILAPTRELAAQIGDSFRAYGEFLKYRYTVIYGGVKQGSQVRALTQGVDIVIATPGRLLDLLNQKKLTLNDIKFFVLDEADRMLDMGFIHDIRKIISKLPPKRQSLFFSATMSSKVNQLARKLLTNPMHVEVAPQATTVETIKQYVFFVDSHAKERLLLELLKQKHLTSVLIFTRTKHRANSVAMFLRKNKIPSDAIHGNKSQAARMKAIRDFKTGRVKVLVATDIAARGIDIDNISHVINFELPNEPESYVHRIGRTARAGAEGTSFSFCAAEERSYLGSIERLIKQNIEVMDHSFHSETAKNAVGSAAKLPHRGGGRRSFNPRNAGGRHGAKPSGRFGKGRSGGGSGGRFGGRSEGRSSSRFSDRSGGQSDRGNSGGRSEGRSDGGSGRQSDRKFGKRFGERRSEGRSQGSSGERSSKGKFSQRKFKHKKPRSKFRRK